MGVLRAEILLVLLAGCPTVDLGDTPPDIGQCNPMGGLDYFQNTIWPNYLNNTTKACVQAACHDQGGNGGLLRYVTSPSIDYPGNYRKSLVDLNCSMPSASLMLTKPTGFDPHGGGTIFSMSDPLAQTFLAWFQ